MEIQSPIQTFESLFLSLRGRLLSSYLGCPDVKKKASIDGISANSQPNIVPIQA